MNNFGAPFSYCEENLYNSMITPSTVHITNTGLANFFQRYFFQRVMSVFKWKLPKTWSKNYMLEVLYWWGWIAVINTDKYGVIPQGCGLKGYDVFYQPTNAVIANPLLQGIREPRIGKECEIIRMSPDWRGVYDIVTYYGDQMALTAQALGMNLVNSKLAYLFVAQNKAGAESLKKLYDTIQEGNPAAVIDKNLIREDGRPNWEFIAQNLSQNHIAPNLLAEMQTINRMFDTEIGIPSANTEKRERLITDEVNANNVETLSKAALWLEYMRESVERVNKMFDLNITVDWRFRPNDGVVVAGGDDRHIPRAEISF